MHAIQVTNITKSFGQTQAIAGVSFTVERGEIFGFLGPNGAGKTTTIHLLLGLLEPTDGRAEVLGFDTRTQADEVRTRTGALLEHPGIYEQLSAEDNLEFYGRVWRLPAAERQAASRNCSPTWACGSDERRGPGRGARDEAEAGPGPGPAPPSAPGVPGRADGRARRGGGGGGARRPGRPGRPRGGDGLPDHPQHGRGRENCAARWP